MKVLLIAPSLFFQDVAAIREHYHLFYLWSYVKQRNPGVDIEVLDLGREIGRPNSLDDVDTFLEITEYLLRHKGFDLVGISCWSTLHYLSTMAVARLCKRLNPEAPVVVGGYHASYVSEDFCFPGTPVDYVVKGEGEDALHKLINGQVPKEGSPTIVQGVPIDLEDEPLLWDEDYPYFRNTEALGLFTSRGCPYSCSFCLDRVTKRRGFSARRTVAEIDTMLRLYPQARIVMMYDPLWGIDPRWRKEFLPLLLARPYAQDVFFWAETRVETLKPDDIDLLARFADFHISMGMESASPTMLAIMQKTRNPEQYLRQFHELTEYMHRRRFVHTFFQMYNFPGETTATLNESREFWLRYYALRPESYTVFAHSPYQFYPGSLSYQQLAEFEARFGTRVLQPQWWKHMRPDLGILYDQILPSRELGEAGAIGYYKEVAGAIREAMFARLAPAAYRRLELDSQNYDVHVSLEPRAPGYFRRLHLRRHEQTYAHEQPDGRLTLYSFLSRKYFNCPPEMAGYFGAALREGWTLAQAIDNAAPYYPDAADREARVTRLFRGLSDNGIVEFYQPPAAAGAPPALPVSRAVLRLNVGELELELFPGEAPLAVASFAHLARLGFYDGLQFVPIQRMAYVAVGLFALPDGGPKYELPHEPNGRKHERGAVAMMRHGPAVHGSRLMICYEAQPQLDGKQTVFGRVLRGMDVLDRLQMGDYVERVLLPVAAPAAD